MKLTHGSLYSGIGGWLLAAQWAEIENIFTVEIDDFCNKILKKYFKVEQHKDIKEFNGTKYRGAIDIISTSDPCQPFSFAGKRGGTTDDRYLWPQTIRIIREIRPPYVVFENVPGFISMALETVASDLEAEGYTVEPFIIPACAVGAWHRRNRLWIIAYTGLQRQAEYEKQTMGVKQYSKDVSNTDSQGLQTQREQTGLYEKKGETCSGIKRRSLLGERWIESWWESEPGICRVAHGIPSRVDRLKSLGNSIVPQIAYIIFEAIKEYEINNQDFTHN